MLIGALISYDKSLDNYKHTYVSLITCSGKIQESPQILCLDDIEALYKQK